MLRPEHEALALLEVLALLKTSLRRSTRQRQGKRCMLCDRFVNVMRDRRRLRLGAICMLMSAALRSDREVDEVLVRLARNRSLIRVQQIPLGDCSLAEECALAAVSQLLQVAHMLHQRRIDNAHFLIFYDWYSVRVGPLLHDLDFLQ